MKIIDLFLKKQKIENMNNFLVDTTKGMIKYEAEIRVRMERYFEEQIPLNEMTKKKITSTNELKDMHSNNIPFNIYNSMGRK